MDFPTQTHYILTPSLSVFFVSGGSARHSTETSYCQLIDGWNMDPDVRNFNGPVRGGPDWLCEREEVVGDGLRKTDH